MPVRPIRGQTVLERERPDARRRRPCPAPSRAIGDAVGREAKVALYPGRPILESQIGAPALVERNPMVRMNYAEGPLPIITEGRALDRAAVGEPVRVMNLTSKQTVTGAVAADGSVEVGPMRQQHLALALACGARRPAASTRSAGRPK